MDYNALSLDESIPVRQRKTDAQTRAFGERIVGWHKDTTTGNVLDVIGKKLFSIAIFNENSSWNPFIPSAFLGFFLH
jgi:hypothetical protein